MPGLLPDVDPDGLLEYSVVYTDRSLNHMSQRFQEVMRDVSATLKKVYRAHSTAIVPGSGTFGMEAVARQFATNQHCLIVRNGQFSYRWSQILETGAIAASTTVLKACRLEPQDKHSPFAPAPIEEVERTILEERPAVVFAPHVETSAGLLLPDDYLKRMAAAVREVDGLFVLDCIASGTLWVDMAEIGVDVLVSAPQKGWSGLPCCGMVMLSERARKRIEETVSTSFACDLRKWLWIMETYENGGHAYYATLPTDGLARLRDIMTETAEYGFERVCEEQWALGHGVRELLARYGYRSVAAPGFEAPGVVVCYTSDPAIVGKFAAVGIQVAGGVPLMCDEGDDYQAFRIGLFGLDKLHDLERSLANLEAGLKQLG